MRSASHSRLKLERDWSISWMSGAEVVTRFLHVCIPAGIFIPFFAPCLPEQSIKMFIRGRPITMYVPSNINNYEELKMEPPSESLELDWVYPAAVCEKKVQSQ